MRVIRYVALEGALAVGVLAGVGVGSSRAVSVVATRIDRLRQDERALAWLGPHGDISRPPDFDIAVEPAGTFLGMSDDLLLGRARAGRIVRAKLNKGGSSISFRLDFADGSRAAFKPTQTNLQTIPRKEIAAYRLNRLLGLNAVPPASARAVSRDELLQALHPESTPFLPRIRAETLFDASDRTLGEVSYWIPQIVDSGYDTPEGQQESGAWLTQGAFIPPEKRSMAAQIADMVVFDFLTNNPDRYSGGNMKMSPDGSHLYFMDNTMSFFLDDEGHEITRKALLRTERFSRRLYDALGRVSEDNLRGALASDGSEPTAILTQAEMRSVVARRDMAERHIRDLVAVYGPDAVLLFP